MSSRVLVSLTAGAALVGYLMGGRAVRAQDSPWPFRIGETATFLFTPEWSRECRIEEVRGTFVRCRNSAGVQGEYWVNVSEVGGIQVGGIRKTAPGDRRP